MKTFKSVENKKTFDDVQAFQEFKFETRGEVYIKTGKTEYMNPRTFDVNAANSFARVYPNLPKFVLKLFY